MHHFHFQIKLLQVDYEIWRKKKPKTHYFRFVLGSVYIDLFSSFTFSYLQMVLSNCPASPISEKLVSALHQINDNTSSFPIRGIANLLKDLHSPYESNKNACERGGHPQQVKPMEASAQGRFSHLLERGSRGPRWVRPSKRL